MNILLVDDDAMCRASLSDFLINELEHKVTCCANGKLAFEKFKKSKYDLVLSDIKMPKMDGIELLNSIRKLEHGKNTDVVLITGHADLNIAIQALRLHAFDFIQKPVSIGELASIIKRSQTKENISEKMDLMGEICI